MNNSEDIFEKLGHLINKDDLSQILTELRRENSLKKSAESKLSKQDLAKKGIFTGSTPPYGYSIKEGKLVLKDNHTPNVVKRIFNEYIQGKGFESIARGLCEDGIQTPRGNSCKWGSSTIRTILENPHYTGDLVQSRTSTIDPSNPKNRVKNNESDLILVPNSHEPIISKKDFDLVRELINQRKKKRPATQTNIFSNLLYCKDCGKGMHYKKSLNSFICGGYSKYGKKVCSSNHKIKEDDLNALVLKSINNKNNSSISKLNSEILNREIERIEIFDAKTSNESITIKYRD